MSFKIIVVSDNIDEAKKYMYDEFRCTRIGNCPDDDWSNPRGDGSICNVCPFQINTETEEFISPYMEFRTPEEMGDITSASNIRDTVINYCAHAKCHTDAKGTGELCQFNKDGKCDFGYNCPADLKENKE